MANLKYTQNVIFSHLTTIPNMLLVRCLEITPYILDNYVSCHDVTCSIDDTTRSAKTVDYLCKCLHYRLALEA